MCSTVSSTSYFFFFSFERKKASSASVKAAINSWRIVSVVKVVYDDSQPDAPLKMFILFVVKVFIFSLICDTIYFMEILRVVWSYLQFYWISFFNFHLPAFLFTLSQSFLILNVVWILCIMVN